MRRFRFVLVAIAGALAAASAPGCGPTPAPSASIGHVSEASVGGCSCTYDGSTCADISYGDIPDDGVFYITTFGGGSDTQGMSCGGTADGTWAYVADRERFGCGTLLLVENGAGQSCVAQVADCGPGRCVEDAASDTSCAQHFPILDSSPFIANYLFGSSSFGWSDHQAVNVTVLGPDAVVGCPGDPGTATGDDAAGDDLGGAPGDDLGGDFGDDLGGAPGDDLGGAPGDDLGGDFGDDLGGAPGDDLGGTSGDDLGGDDLGTGGSPGAGGSQAGGGAGKPGASGGSKASGGAGKSSVPTGDDVGDDAAGDDVGDDASQGSGQNGKSHPGEVRIVGNPANSSQDAGCATGGGGTDATLVLLALGLLLRRRGR